MHWSLQALLLVLVLTAAVTDLRARRIPNWLTLPAGFLALAIHLTLAGTQGALWSLFGLALAGLVYLLPYLLGWMGGGDLKLMAAAGAIVGPQLWLRLFFWSAILGGVFALIALVRDGRFRRALENISQMVREAARLRSPRAKNPELDIRSDRAVTTPHGVAIAIAALIVLSGR